MKSGNLALAIIFIVLISGCSACPPKGPWPMPPWCNGNEAANNLSDNSVNLSANITQPIPEAKPDEYTFYVSIPANTPVTDSINITFFSDVDWQLWKPMTKINDTYWVYSMPAGWLPEGATTITYGYSRNSDSYKTELFDSNNKTFWINRSFVSNRQYGFVAYDRVKSWRDIITRYPGENITGIIHAIVPLDTARVTLINKDLVYELTKVKDFYYSISLVLPDNSSFTLTAYYENNSVINSNDFLFNHEVFAYVSEPGAGREFMKGFAFSGGHYSSVSVTRGNYMDYVNSTYDLMKAKGTNWVSFNPVWFLTNYTTSDLRPIYREEYGLNGWSGWMHATQTDEEVRLMIRWAHDRGFKVFMMPYLSTLNWSETVPGKGNLAPVNVTAFFESYTNFIVHYAIIGEEEGVELISLGNELDSVTDDDNTLSTGYSKTNKWYDIISKVREVYNGSLTYSCSCMYTNQLCTPERIKFWDKLDYIGFEWYLPLSSNINATMSELIDDTKAIIDNKIKPLSEKFGGKPVLFTEYGWSAKPYAWTTTYTGGGGGNFDKYAAVFAYEAVYQAIRNEDVAIGMFPCWPLGDEADLEYLKDYNGPDVRFSIIEPEIAKWYTYFR